MGLTREVWGSLPDALQWHLLAIDGEPVGAEGVSLAVILDAVMSVRALVDSFRDSLGRGA